MAESSSATGGGHGTAQPSPGPADEARRALQEIARLQLAALAAGPALLRQWADIVAGCGEEISRSLGAAARDPGRVPDAMGAALESYARCLEQLTRLPRIHALRVLVELDRLRSEDARPGSGLTGA